MRSVIGKVDRVIESYRNKGRSKSIKNQTPLFSYKSQENHEDQTEATNEGVSKQFDRDRITIADNLKKRALLTNLTAKFKNALIKNLKERKDFRCYEHPKKPYMTDFIKQAELINKIGLCELISGSENNAK